MISFFYCNFAQFFKTIMSNHVKLERINSSGKVAIYSVLYEGETQNEFQKFIGKYGADSAYKHDLEIILARIQKIEKDGAADRHFRYEGKMREHIRAIPPNIETSKLRLYCLCFAECILVLGGGGVKAKETRTWQDDPQLTKCVTELQKMDKVLSAEIRKNPLKFKNIESLSDIDILIN